LNESEYTFNHVHMRALCCRYDDDGWYREAKKLWASYRRQWLVPWTGWVSLQILNRKSVGCCIQTSPTANYRSYTLRPCLWRMSAEECKQLVTFTL